MPIPRSRGNNAVLVSQKLLKINWKYCGQFLPGKQLEAAAKFEEPTEHDSLPCFDQILTP
ncbi:hypothetical protein H7849_20485 [Alloacidobacterium dinghuense]|uniref:Uncharacterized protein n=1 Tax=Alloacidobacterium dinghuense TaxID=2763107 RepID=A0A7G8BFW0_9BACT|nr:hypothetical protein [Alloacidobacterium dinghuense]QNI31430.1 hypothetical protein H7849_20485 [Alloacidobacterium dinghuense]